MPVWSAKTERQKIVRVDGDEHNPELIYLCRPAWGEPIAVIYTDGFEISDEEAHLVRHTITKNRGWNSYDEGILRRASDNYPLGQLVVEVADVHDKLVRDFTPERFTVAERLDLRGVLRNPVALTIGDRGQPAHWPPESPDLQWRVGHGGIWRHHTEGEQKRIVDVYGNPDLDDSHRDRNFGAHREWLRKLNGGRGTRLGYLGMPAFTHGIYGRFIAATRRHFREADWPPPPSPGPRVHAVAAFKSWTREHPGAVALRAWDPDDDWGEVVGVSVRLWGLRMDRRPTHAYGLLGVNYRYTGQGVVDLDVKAPEDQVYPVDWLRRQTRATLCGIRILGVEYSNGWIWHPHRDSPLKWWRTGMHKWWLHPRRRRAR